MSIFNLLSVISFNLYKEIFLLFFKTISCYSKNINYIIYKKKYINKISYSLTKIILYYFLNIKVYYKTIKYMKIIFLFNYNFNNVIFNFFLLILYKKC